MMNEDEIRESGLANQIAAMMIELRAHLSNSKGDAKLFAGTSSITPGSWVIEVSSRSMRYQGDHFEGLGRFVCYYYPNEQSAPSYCIKTLAGELQRWENCRFLALPPAFGAEGREGKENKEWAEKEVERFRESLVEDGEVLTFTKL